MKTHPILFSTSMVKSILKGDKTQTRRLIKNKNATSIQPGDILWVREMFYSNPEHDKASPKQLVNIGLDIFYVADLTNEEIINPVNKRKNRPSIFMPKEACRIFLEVTELRSEKLQDISDKDCMSEGIFKNEENRYGVKPAKLTWDKAINAFRFLWIIIHGFDSWDENPKVWVYTFKRVERPANFLNS